MYDAGQKLNHVTGNTSVKVGVFTGCLKHVQTIYESLWGLEMEMVMVGRVRNISNIV